MCLNNICVYFTFRQLSVTAKECYTNVIYFLLANYYSQLQGHFELTIDPIHTVTQTKINQSHACIGRLPPRCLLISPDHPINYLPSLTIASINRPSLTKSCQLLPMLPTINYSAQGTAVPERGPLVTTPSITVSPVNSQRANCTGTIRGEGCSKESMNRLFRPEGQSGMRLRPTMLPYLCHLNPDKTISQKIARFDVKRGSGNADDAAKPTNTESTFTCSWSLQMNTNHLCHSSW